MKWRQRLFEFLVRVGKSMDEDTWRSFEREEARKREREDAAIRSAERRVPLYPREDV